MQGPILRNSVSAEKFSDQRLALCTIGHNFIQYITSDKKLFYVQFWTKSSALIAQKKKYIKTYLHREIALKTLIYLYGYPIIKFTVTLSVITAKGGSLNRLWVNKQALKGASQ
jgi:hypothetical protein